MAARNLCSHFLLCSLLIACGGKHNTTTATVFIYNQPEAKTKNKKIIWVAIAPYHEIDSSTTQLISTELESFYRLKTIILPKAIMSDTLLAWSKKRYNANKILTHLSKIKPNNVAYILAITNDRIAACGDSTHESGVAGLGTRSGQCCVISTIALRNKLKDEEQYTQRLIKACMHEMGHNFGLAHCKKKDKKCLMRDAAGTILTLDEEEIYLCKNCISILKTKGIGVREKSSKSLRFL